MPFNLNWFTKNFNNTCSVLFDFSAIILKMFINFDHSLHSFVELAAWITNDVLNKHFELMHCTQNSLVHQMLSRWKHTVETAYKEKKHSDRLKFKQRNDFSCAKALAMQHICRLSAMDLGSGAHESILCVARCFVVSSPSFSVVSFDFFTLFRFFFWCYEC